MPPSYDQANARRSGASREDLHALAALLRPGGRLPRAPTRLPGEHLRLAWEAHERGELALAGALAEPTDGVVLFFRGPGPEAAERFARNDPYVINGLVTDWRVREWTTVVGGRPGQTHATRGSVIVEDG